MTVQLVITGMDDLRAKLVTAGKNAPSQLAAGIWQEAEVIMAASRPLVPVDEGTLRASGIVETPDLTPSGASVTFGYGGAASDYAVIQHERLDYTHTSGQAKFLEQPTLEAAAGMAGRLAERIGRLFG
jgi:hypothetical protein